jgi:hypothetical protein
MHAWLNKSRDARVSAALHDAAVTKAGSREALAHVEDMLAAAVQSSRGEARFWRAAGALGAIVHTARERRQALAFRHWSARVSEGAVNAELIYERAVLVACFERKRDETEAATGRLLAAVRAAALRACVSHSRLDIVRALTDWARAADGLRAAAAARAHALARAAAACARWLERRAVGGALGAWAGAVRLLAQREAGERARLSARECVVVELRLRALCVLSSAGASHRARLANALGAWSAGSRAVGAAEAATAALLAATARSRALRACVEAAVAARAAADGAAVASALARWSRQALRGEACAAVAAAKLLSRQHVRVALAARARGDSLQVELERAAAALAASEAAKRDELVGGAAAPPAASAPTQQAAPRAATAVAARACAGAPASEGGDDRLARAEAELGRLGARLESALRESDSAHSQLEAVLKGALRPCSPSIGGSEALGQALLGPSPLGDGRSAFARVGGAPQAGGAGHGGVMPVVRARTRPPTPPARLNPLR